jgi:hypothetical protein
MTVWDVISPYLKVIATLVLIIAAVLVLMFYPPREKEFSPNKNEQIELQASTSGAKLKFLGYEVFDGLNHCLLELEPSGPVFKLPATYTQDASGKTTPFPNQNLTIQIDGEYNYTLVGGTFVWNGDHVQQCYFNATLTSGSRLKATIGAISRWVRFTF